MDGLSVLPNAIPAIVLAVGVILAWKQPVPADHALWHGGDPARGLYRHSAALSDTLCRGPAASDQRFAR